MGPESVSLLDHVIDIKHTLGVMETKLDLLDGKLDTHIAQNAADHAAFESRLDQLETKNAEEAAVERSKADSQESQSKFHDRKVMIFSIVISSLIAVAAAILGALIKARW